MNFYAHTSTLNGPHLRGETWPIWLPEQDCNKRQIRQ